MTEEQIKIAKECFLNEFGGDLAEWQAFLSGFKAAIKYVIIND